LRNSAFRLSRREGRPTSACGLYRAALVTLISRGTFTDKVKGRGRQKGITTEMRLKLAAKILVIAWAPMKKKEVFDPGRIE